MPAELLRIHPRNPEGRKIDRVVDYLRRGAVAIYPTDSVYAMGCNLHNKRAVEKLSQILHTKPSKLTLSFICADIIQASEYVRRIDTPVYKLMNRSLPGPYTFILEAGSRVSRFLDSNRKTVGIRVPDHPITQALVARLGNPLVTASVKDEDTIRQYTTDPDEIYEDFRHEVDIVIDGGPGGNIPSTVVDCSGDRILLVREGLGPIDGMALDV